MLLCICCGVFSWCTLFTGAKHPNDASYYQFSGILLHWIIIYFFVLFFPVQILLSALIIFYLDNELIVHIPISIFSCSFYLLLLLGPFCKIKMTHMAHFKCTQLISMLFPIPCSKVFENCVLGTRHMVRYMLLGLKEQEGTP
jgi:hypothetical protein